MLIVGGLENPSRCPHGIQRYSGEDNGVSTASFAERKSKPALYRQDWWVIYTDKPLFGNKQVQSLRSWWLTDWIVLLIVIPARTMYMFMRRMFPVLFSFAILCSNISLIFHLPIYFLNILLFATYLLIWQIVIKINVVHIRNILVDCDGQSQRYDVNAIFSYDAMVRISHMIAIDWFSFLNIHIHKYIQEKNMF